jgi:hypothetical protein
MKSQFLVKLAAITVALSVATAGFADDYASKNGWRFLNFSACPSCTPPIDNTLSWDVYRDALIGIPPAEDPWSSAFDVVFYEQVFKSKLSQDGNCFGMSLLNLMIQKNGGHLGYCTPVTQYSGDPTSAAMGPTDLMLRRAINVMHGHQVNLPTVQFLLNIFAQHFNRDGAYAFDQFNYWQSRGDLTLVSITKDISPSDGGHTLIAYRSVDLGGGNKKIFVVDPNRTWGRTTDQAWYNSESNFIQITGHAWSFDMGGGDTWSGDLGTGGNLVITPVSVTGPLSRSPASLGDTIVGNLLNSLLLSGDSPHVEQVTDARGKRLYKPGTSEIDTDSSTGMLNMLPWYLSDQQNPRHQPGGVLLFQIGESGGTLRISISAGPGGYTLRSMGGRTIVAVTARGGSGMDTLTIEAPGTADAKVSLENSRGATEYDVVFTRAQVPHQEVRVLSSSSLRINGQGTVEVGLSKAGQALQISSSHAALRYNLALGNITRQGQNSLARSEVMQEPGASRSVQPRDWQKLKDTQVVEQWRAFSPR